MKRGKIIRRAQKKISRRNIKRKRLIKYNPEDYENAKILHLEHYKYPNNGLYYKIEDIPPNKEMLKLSLEKQIEYADAISRRYAKHPQFIKEQYSFLDAGDDVELSKVSISNFAFLLYHNKNDTILKKCYDKIIEIVTKRVE